MASRKTSNKSISDKLLSCMLKLTALQEDIEQNEEAKKLISLDEISKFKQKLLIASYELHHNK